MSKLKEMEFSEMVCGIILILILAVLPLIVHVEVRPMNEFELQFVRSSEDIIDVFSYDKSIFLCVMAVLLIINAGLEYVTTMEFDKDFFKSNFVRLMLAYGAFVILSTLFSKYMSLSFSGAAERCEGIWTLLSYVIIAVTAYSFVKSKTHFKFILVGVALSVIFVGGIGYYQSMGMDYFKCDIIAKFLLEEYYGKLNVRFTEVFSTLYNPDCVGLFTALLLPVTAYFAIMLKIKDPFKYLWSLLFIILMFCLIGSDSTGGLIGFLTSTVITVIIVMVYLLVKNRNMILVGAIAAVLAAVIVVCIFVPQVRDKIDNTIDVIVNPPQNDRFEYRDLRIEGDTAIIETKYGNITLEYNKENNTVNAVMPENEKGKCINGIETNSTFYKNVNINWDERTVNIETEKGSIVVVLKSKDDVPFYVKGLSGEEITAELTENKKTKTISGTFNVNNYGAVKLSIGNSNIVYKDNYGSFLFKYKNNNLYNVNEYKYTVNKADDASEVKNLIVAVDPDRYFELKNQKSTKIFRFCYTDKLNAVSKKGQIIDINEKVPSMIFKNEYFANGRGFIWSRSIPLMFKASGIFFGSGPDTFAISFPQYDLAANTRTHGNPDLVVDKPHNMFIQMAVNTGLISLIILLTVFVMYIISTIRAIFVNKVSDIYVFAARIGILGGIIGYLITGLTTDSVVSVAPLFWVLLGTGFAINKIKDEKNKNIDI